VTTRGFQGPFAEGGPQKGREAEARPHSPGGRRHRERQVGQVSLPPFGKTATASGCLFRFWAGPPVSGTEVSNPACSSAESVPIRFSPVAATRCSLAKRRSRRHKKGREPLVLAAVAALAQAPGKRAIDLPDPYGPGVKFGELPAGRLWSGVIAITADRDGHNIWAFERCGSVSCVNSDLPTSP
jgi:hypothetical protein